jgi:predicted SAM-dependent methyltransferase
MLSSIGPTHYTSIVRGKSNFSFETITVKKHYVQYGSGNETIKGWVNFDASPTLRIQKIPIIGVLCRPILNCIFDGDIRYGDIIRGLPIKASSVDGVFCSHVLEHLSLEDFNKALENTFKILKPGGVFRCIVPDLEMYIREYIDGISSGSSELQNEAAVKFCRGTNLGMLKRRRDIIGRLSEAYGNSGHRWMWDRYSLSRALLDHGFVDVETFEKGNCADEMFLLPERDHQFHRGIGIQCRKPV